MKIKVKIEKSIKIKSSVSHVYKIISDLNQWNTWSPWIHMEKTAQTEVTGQSQIIGQKETWD